MCSSSSLHRRSTLPLSFWPSPISSSYFCWWYACVPLFAHTCTLLHIQTHTHSITEDAFCVHCYFTLSFPSSSFVRHYLNLNFFTRSFLPFSFSSLLFALFISGLHIFLCAHHLRLLNHGRRHRRRLQCCCCCCWTRSCAGKWRPPSDEGEGEEEKEVSPFIIGLLFFLFSTSATLHEFCLNAELCLPNSALGPLLSAFFSWVFLHFANLFLQTLYRLEAHALGTVLSRAVFTADDDDDRVKNLKSSAAATLWKCPHSFLLHFFPFSFTSNLSRLYNLFSVSSLFLCEELLIFSPAVFSFSFYRLWVRVVGERKGAAVFAAAVGVTRRHQKVLFFFSYCSCWPAMSLLSNLITRQYKADKIGQKQKQKRGWARIQIRCHVMWTKKRTWFSFVCLCSWALFVLFSSPLSIRRFAPSLLLLITVINITVKGNVFPQQQQQWQKRPRTSVLFSCVWQQQQQQLCLLVVIRGDTNRRLWLRRPNHQHCVFLLIDSQFRYCTFPLVLTHFGLAF